MKNLRDKLLMEKTTNAPTGQKQTGFRPNIGKKTDLKG